MADRKKLLIFAHYYIPDVASTGQILAELAEGMLGVFDVTVICAVPSYEGAVEKRYTARRLYRENINGVNVFRVRVPAFSKGDKASRVKNILAYFFGAAFAVFKAGAADYVFTISQPPILGGLLGVWGKWVKRAKYIYSVQDFNPEQTMAVGYSKNRLVLGTMMRLDKFSCKRADKVVVIGCDMAETLKKRFNDKNVPPFAVINNWVNEKEIFPLPLADEKVRAFKRRHGLDDKFVIMYSGNIGLYYDLENLMRIIENFKAGTLASDGREVAFAFVGAGSMLEQMVLYKEKNRMENVFFIPYQDKSELVYSLNAGDVHFCINAKGIKGVSVPSKCYGIMAAGRPVLAVLSEGTEARLLVEKAGCGLCCEPGDYDAVERNIRWFIENAAADICREMGMNGRRYLEEHLTRDRSIRKYIDAMSDC